MYLLIGFLFKKQLPISDLVHAKREAGGERGEQKLAGLLVLRVAQRRRVQLERLEASGAGREQAELRLRVAADVRPERARKGAHRPPQHVLLPLAQAQRARPERAAEARPPLRHAQRGHAQEDGQGHSGQFHCAAGQASDHLCQAHSRFQDAGYRGPVGTAPR